MNGCAKIAELDVTIEVLTALPKHRILTTEEIHSCYDMMKPDTIQGFSASEIVELVELEVIIDSMDSWPYWCSSKLDEGIQSRIDRLTEFQLKNLASTKYIKNAGAGTLIEIVGFKKLKNYALELLEFLKDMNWPAFGSVCTPLGRGEEEILPAVKEILRSAFPYLDLVLHHHDRAYC